MKGRTRWYPRSVRPVRHGVYECLVRVAGGLITGWELHWDGVGFVVPVPMSVIKWRGMTKKAHDEALRERP